VRAVRSAARTPVHGRATGFAGNGRHDGSVPACDDAGQITAGFEHACIVSSVGRINCWGYNANGPLGNTAVPAAVAASTPQEVVGLDNTMAVAAGINHSCAVLDDGTARCWVERCGSDRGWWFP